MKGKPYTECKLTSLLLSLKSRLFLPISVLSISLHDLGWDFWSAVCKTKDSCALLMQMKALFSCDLENKIDTIRHYFTSKSLNVALKLLLQLHAEQFIRLFRKYCVISRTIEQDNPLFLLQGRTKPVKCIDWNTKKTRAFT